MIRKIRFILYLIIVLITERNQSLNKRVTMKILTLLFLVLISSTHADFNSDITASLLERTTHDVTYDGSYLAIGYPNGDVPENIGVCTDVIIRAYRGIGVDLQKLVHEDMRASFSEYPSNRIWGLNSTDKNIDHRRVPNLQTFLKRHGQELVVTRDKADYAVGDIVTWMVNGNLPHIGMVVDKVSFFTGNPLVVHNIGRGPKLEDMIFNFKITGHYRYVPAHY